MLLEDGCIYIYQGKGKLNNLFLTEVASISLGALPSNFEDGFQLSMNDSLGEDLKDGFYAIPEDFELPNDLIVGEKYIYQNNTFEIHK